MGSLLRSPFDKNWWIVYMLFLKALGVFLFCFILLLMIYSSEFRYYHQIWLSRILNSKFKILFFMKYNVKFVLTSMAQDWDKNPYWTKKILFFNWEVLVKKSHRKKERFMKPTDEQIIGVFNHLLGMLWRWLMHSP